MFFCCCIRFYSPVFNIHKLLCTVNIFSICILIERYEILVNIFLKVNVNNLLINILI